MRFHLVAAIYVLCFSAFYELSSVEYAILISCIGLVMLCEMFNTAIEVMMNRLAPAYDSAAKIAKDVAAGAVLIAAIASVVVGFFLFWDTVVFAKIFAFFTSNPLWFFILMLSVVVSLLFIFIGPKELKK